MLDDREYPDIRDYKENLYPGEDTRYISKTEPVEREPTLDDELLDR